MSDKKISKGDVRKSFTKCYEFIDEVVKVFGRGGINRIVWIKEGDKEMGKQTVIDPESVVKLSEMCIDSHAFCAPDENGNLLRIRCKPAR